MIDTALITIAQKLGEFLESRYAADKAAVRVGGLSHKSGSGEEEDALDTNKNEVLVTLVNLQEEKVVRGAHQNYFGPISLNLSVLISAFPDSGDTGYSDALRKLSFVIAYLRSNRVWDAQSTPELSPDIDKLTFELENLDNKESSEVWSKLGGKYQPSVLYRVRMITLAEELTGSGPVVGIRR